MRGTPDDADEDRLGLAELSALADGTLDPARRSEVETRIAASPELRDRLEQERRAVAALAAARQRERAPETLRARIEATRTRGGQSSRAVTPAGKRFVAGRAARLAALGAVAAVALALVLTRPSGTPAAPSVAEAAALAARGASMPPPRPDAAAPRWLRAGVGRLRFPNWSSTLGWHASGERRDTIDGRRVLTVYYASAGRTVAYSIVSGPALPPPAAAGTASGAYYVQELQLGQRSVATWRQAGHTCLLSAAGVPEHVLAGLAGGA